MEIKLFLLLIFLLAINDHVYGKNVDKTKSVKLIHKNIKQKDSKSRTKRSLNEDIDKLFISSKDLTQHDHVVEERGKVTKLQPIADKELPFWGARGRRVSSEETIPNIQLPTYNHNKHLENIEKSLLNYQNKLRRDEGDSPFWGNRGRRDSGESDENDINLFWANRGRRQDEEPFWGTRGSREESHPVLGNSGRYDDDEPFWGNRGRRQEQEPFWGNRGRRENSIIGNNGEKNKVKTIHINEVDEPYGKYQDKFKIKLKNSIIETIDDIQSNVDNFSRNRRQETQLRFWPNRGRDSKLQSLFNGKMRNRLHHILNDQIKGENYELRSKYFEPNTVHDSRIYAEEPRYILVERSSRSSAEEDPFFISRGKKYSEYDLDNGIRGRRGSLEELVKSVRNDPYYIARGKRVASIKTDDSTTNDDHLYKTKELVCSTVNLLMTKNQRSKVKRDINDPDRNRRTILKKLALQLQMDPYFVSRGKKNDESREKLNVQDFINKILVMCD